MDHEVPSILKSSRNTSCSLLDSLFETDFIAKIWLKYSGNSGTGVMYEQLIYIKLPGDDSLTHISAIL